MRAHNATVAREVRCDAFPPGRRPSAPARPCPMAPTISSPRPAAVSRGVTTPATAAGAALERRWWWTVFALCTLMGVTWALSTPLMTGPDEASHALRAAAVARGQLVGGAGRPVQGFKNILVPVDVPGAYASAGAVGACFMGTPRTGSLRFQVPGARPPCPPFRGPDHEVSVLTQEYRGQPSYYAAVGAVTLVFSGATGAYAMRLVSALLSAALLASALVSARRLPRPTLAGIGVLAAATPVVFYFSGSVNTSSLEIAAAIGLWAAGLLVVRGSGLLAGRDIARAGLAFVVLALTRGLGPAFAVSIAAALGVLAGRKRLQRLVRRRDVRIWVAAAIASLVASAAWLLSIQSAYPLSDRPSGLAHALGLQPFFLEQTVGVFGPNDTVLPAGLDLVWAAAVVLLLVALVGYGRPVERGVVATVLVGALVLQVSAEGLSIPPIGYAWQGRYTMPLLVGVPVLCGGLVGGRGRSGPPVRLERWARWAGAGLVAVQAIAFWSVLRHHAGHGRAEQGLVGALFDPRWRPPLLPPVAYLVGYVALCGVLTGLVLRSNLRRAPSAAPR